jgi:hypothetical protein
MPCNRQKSQEILKTCSQDNITKGDLAPFYTNGRRPPGCSLCTSFCFREWSNI